MPPTISQVQRRSAKRQMMGLIKQGASVQQARSLSAVPMHRATVYRLLQRVRAQGEAAFTDRRRGHPIKLRGEVRTFLIEMCQRPIPAPFHHGFPRRYACHRVTTPLSSPHLNDHDK